MYHLRTACRACGLGGSALSTLKQSTAAGDVYRGDNKLTTVLDLGIQPLANDFRAADEEHAGYAPLKVNLCPRCGLAQLSVVVNPTILYRHYSYVTSHSDTMMRHFGQLREDIVREAPTADSVLEVGSNDGTLLSILKHNPFAIVIGIDPSENLTKIANQNGIYTRCEFFCLNSLNNELTPSTPKDVVIARHVMCHIDDWKDFVGSLERVTHKESLVYIEVPYALHQIRGNSFDQVYHEHLSYMTLEAMRSLLVGTDFHLHKVIHYTIHGGVIGMMLRRNSSTKPVDRSVDDNLEMEGTIEWESEWRELNHRSENSRRNLCTLVRSLIAERKTVCGFGASAKSTVWMGACGFTRREIKFIADSTTQKWYKLSPGTDIPIVDEGALLRDLPDYAIVFAWNFLPEILQKQQLYRDKGGKFITPVPKVEIV